MNKEFKDKTVLITGGTGDIGSSLVKSFYSLGAKIITTTTKPKNINNKHNSIKYYHLDFLKSDTLNFFLNDIKKITKFETSSVVPNFCKGILLTISFKFFFVLVLFVNFVIINPGDTELTIIPYLAKSKDIPLVKPFIPCLLAEYIDLFSLEIFPQIDDMLIIFPLILFLIIF